MDIEELLEKIFGEIDDSDMLVRRRKFADFKVIFQKEKTVLKVEDEVFIARCEEGEEFDPEKGLMVCLLKYFGITTSDILYLMEKSNFKKQNYSNNHIKSDKKVVENGKKGRSRCTKSDKV